MRRCRRLMALIESITSFEGLGDRVLPPGKLSEASERLGHGKISHAPKDQLTQIYVDHALDFVRLNREQPLFVELWPDDVPDPFEPRPDLFQKYSVTLRTNLLLS